MDIAAAMLFCLNNRRSTFYAFYSPNQIAQPMAIVYETTRQDYEHFGIESGHYGLSSSIWP